MGVARNACSSGSEATTIHDRKRKSNRESARRSRMCKLKQLDDMLSQASQLQGSNKKLLNAIDSVQEKYSVVVADNAVLRAWILELTERLWSLNSVLKVAEEVSGIKLDIPKVPEMVMRQWQLPCPVEPIAATSAEPFRC